MNAVPAIMFQDHNPLLVPPLEFHHLVLPGTGSHPAGCRMSQWEWGGGGDRGSQKYEENRKTLKKSVTWERRTRAVSEAARVFACQSGGEQASEGRVWGGAGGRRFVSAHRDCMGRFLGKDSEKKAS